MQQQTWRPEDYNAHASFVSSLGSPVVTLLNPRSGEKILDLGCGDGTLAAEIQRVGARVVGVDSSPEMIAAATARGVQASVMSGDALTFTNEFDAVFSNATLHWIPNYRAVLSGVYGALKEQGRFVGEFGASGNVQRLVEGIEAVFARNPDFGTFKNPWYFPTESDYAAALEAGGFRVDSIETIVRPTPLPTGVREWLKVFANNVLSGLSAEQGERFLEQVEESVRPSLYDHAKGWSADYVRLRFAATKR
jgi:2-isopropylmalate synthase